tara:strand:- start:519 stop:746 length:228 start_codon:yes stop_codon:yes gene_type:complete
LAEYQPSKLNVAGSTPVPRSIRKNRRKTMERKADAFEEIEKIRSDIKKLRFAVSTISVTLLVSISTLTYVISQLQ